MATITITIPNDKANRFALAAGYQANIIDPKGESIPNPQSPIQFGKDWVLRQIKSEIITYDAKTASKVAYDQAIVQDLSDIT